MAAPDLAFIETMISAVGGETVTFGAESSVGVWDEEEEVRLEMEGPGVMGEIRAFLVPTAEISAKIGNSVTVAGTSYSVVNRRRKGDGALTTLYLAD